MNISISNRGVWRDLYGDSLPHSLKASIRGLLLVKTIVPLLLIFKLSAHLIIARCAWGCASQRFIDMMPLGTATVVSAIQEVLISVYMFLALLIIIGKQ